MKLIVEAKLDLKDFRAKLKEGMLLYTDSKNCMKIVSVSKDVVEIELRDLSTKLKEGMTLSIDGKDSVRIVSILKEFVEVKLNDTKVVLKEGTMLYNASHGPVKVVSVSEKEFFGEKEYFCDMICELDDVRLLVPVSDMEESDRGFRPIISKEMAKKIIDNVLNKQPKGTKGVWTKRIVECETKVYSGNALLIAEVVRDLFGGMKDMNKSYAERVLFDKAFDRFVLEYSIAMGIHQVDANKIVYDIINNNYIAAHKLDVDVCKNDDEKDDFGDNVDLDGVDDDFTDDEDECEHISNKTA